MPKHITKNVNDVAVGDHIVTAGCAFEIETIEKWDDGTTSLYSDLSSENYIIAQFSHDAEIDVIVKE